MAIFRSVRSRMAFYVLGLLSVVQIVAFVWMNAANQRLAREQIGAVLEEGSVTLRRHVDRRGAQVGAALRELPGDERLREALSRRDLGGARDPMERWRTRQGVELLFLAEGNSPLVDVSARRGAAVLAERIGPMAESARRLGLGTSVQMVENEAYLVAVVAAHPARPELLLVAADLLDARFVEELQQSTRLEASVVVREPGGGRRVAASSLPAMRSAALGLALSRVSAGQRGTVEFELYREPFVARLVSLSTDGGEVEAVLLRSLSRELEAFDDVLSAVMFLSIGGLVLSAFGAMFVARTVSVPASALTEAAHSVARGDFPPPVEVRQDDEMGALARAFDGMVKGLAERDRVRAALGKVVSAEVAAKILSREVEVGGEERTATLLFSDLRGFRAVGGPYAPREAVDLLNAYLSRMTAVIERHHGVVDKYLGSGIMAIFGAPVSHDDDAGDAIAAALAMQADLDAFNEELAKNNLPTLEMGIGLHCATVLAGNIGSPDRRSYTVLGEGVAYAARLEGLAARGRIGGRVLASSEAVRRSKHPFAVRALVAAGGAAASDADVVYVVLGEQAPAQSSPAVA